MILVDTSVLMDFLKGKDTPSVRRLVDLESQSAPISLPALCCQEVLQGAKDEDEWKLLLEYLETQRVVLPDDPWATHCAAARIYFECRRRGVTLRSVVDCYIAQLALENDHLLLHSDQDFERIRRVRPLRTLTR